jgi:hypothetical protein
LYEKEYLKTSLLDITEYQERKFQLNEEDELRELKTEIH